MFGQSFIIGVTGNIATGKSVIRRMLGNSGALTIDADQIAHRVLYPGRNAYQAVIDSFGPQILTKNNTISNQILAAIVFKNPDLLKQLESLVHPSVTADIKTRISFSNHPFIVVEAIKLIESGLDKLCDAIWVSDASVEHQTQRLCQDRGLSLKEAKTRIAAQPPQSEKIDAADVVISTGASFKATWHQVQRALNDTITSAKFEKPHLNNLDGHSLVEFSSYPVSQLEFAWQQFVDTSVSSLYKHLGLFKILALKKESKIDAFITLDEWNFTSALQFIEPSAYLSKMFMPYLKVWEQHARRVQNEILLVPEKYSSLYANLLLAKGFNQQAIDQLNYQAWHLAAQRISTDGSPVWIKALTKPFEIAHMQLG